MKPGTSQLLQIDACLSQIATTKTDVASLLTALRNPFWPVQIAAAEALGRRGCREAIPALRRVLEEEHARPKEELYPSDSKASGERTLEHLAKRWRLKTALIVALGRLRDREVVPLLGRILAEARDFYPVYSVAAQAIGRIGGPHALAALEPALKESEHNTRIRAHAARRVLSETRPRPL